MTTEFPEDRVFARHPPLGGAVLIVGGGAIGSLLAWLLVRMGVSQVTIVDREFLELPNLVRHALGSVQLGQPKAPALAEYFRGTFPFGEVDGIDADFLELSEEKQLRLVSRADVVVGAAEIACHRRVNELCLRARVPAVYPAAWVSPRTRDGEVGQILWVLPDRLTPCYECWQPEARRITGDAQAAGGNILDFMQFALVTARVVAALINPTNPNSAVLDPRRTAIYVHVFSPTSRDIQGPFPADGGLRSIEVPVLLPTEPCRVCGQGRHGARARVTAQRAAPEARAAPSPPAPTAPPRPIPSRAPPAEVRRNWLIALAIFVGFILFIIVIYIANTYRTTPSGQSAQSRSQGEGRSGNQAPPGPPYSTPPHPGLASSSPAPTITTPSPAAPAQSAPNWTSPDSFPITYPQDMTTACSRQFGQGSYARLADVSQPSYDIVCVSGGQAYTGLDLDAFCPWLAQQDHYLSSAPAPGWWSGNPERYDPNTSDQPWKHWRCYNTKSRP